MIDKLKEIIIATDYCDARVFDFRCDYFGDEVYLFLENDDNSCWKISFLMCASVQYETDAGWSKSWRHNPKYVCEMRKSQLGYFCQEISLDYSNKFEGFIDVTFDLSIMSGKITCKEIKVDKVNNEDCDFFWNNTSK